MEEVVKIAVTITYCTQIGMETWRDERKTKVFESTEIISEILRWAKTIDQTATIPVLKFSDVVE